MASRVLLLTIDGHAADQLVQPLERRGMSVSVARDPASALQRLGEHQLVILDAPDAASLAMLCRRINDEAGSAHPPILAIAHTGDVEARIRLLEAGADDVLAQPIDERELEAIVEALLLRTPSSNRSEVDQPQMTPRPSGAPGRVIVFASAKGGSGTTTLAVNTALVLAEMAPNNVAIADLDMYHGQVATHLDIYARSSTAALAREEREGSNQELFQEAGRQHSGGLTVFGGPYRPDDAQDVSASQLTGLLEQMRGLYGTVVVDAGSTLDLRTLAVIQAADVVALVLAPDIPSLRLLHACLQVLSEAGTAADRSFFVVNQIYPKPMIGAEQIEEHLGIKVGLEIPYDGENFLKAVNEGQPLVNAAHRSAAAAAIRRLAAQLSTDSAEGEVTQPQRRGLFRGLLGRD
ncbi:MAG: response regulator [Chloroflexota bacterium]